MMEVYSSLLLTVIRDFLSVGGKQINKQNTECRQAVRELAGKNSFPE
jgi:hypothetical protein